MGRLSTIVLVDSGFGYTAGAPTITISLPNQDSGNASAIASIDSAGRVSGAAIDKGGRFYASPPTVTFSLPTGDSADATATATIDSAEVTRSNFDRAPFSLNSVSLTDSGAYYTSAPPISFAVTRNTPSNWKTSDGARSAKWGTYSYVCSSTGGDSDYFNFSNVDSSTTINTGVNLAFWVNLPGARTGDLLHFPTTDDSGSNNKISLEGNNIRWTWTESDGGRTGSVVSSTSPLTSTNWHYVQCVRGTGSNPFHRIYVNGNLLDSDTTATNVDNFIQDRVRIKNTVNVSSVMLDAIKFSFNTTLNGSNPDSDHNPYENGEDSAKNFMGFELKNPQATTTIAAGKVTGFNVTHRGNYLASVTPTIPAATGGPSNFRATATASLDSSEGGSVSALTITDSGGFYTSAPTITIDSANGTAADYRATAICNINDSGKVISITITDSGGGYVPGSFPTVTFVGPPVPPITPGDSASQTLADGTIITGEIAKYSDSDGVLHLTHVGSDDSSLHRFVTGRLISFGPVSDRQVRRVTAVSEDNKLSAVEQNTIFDGFESEFLDFTETNPFGDPQ